MAERFRGTWLHTVDQKGRVSVPAGFRRVLEEGDPGWYDRRPAPPHMVMVVRMRGEDCIACYTVGAMEELEEQILAVEDYFDREKLLNEVTAKAQKLQLDDNGRIVLGPPVRQAIGIGDKALFVGKLEKFEIWEPDAYAALQARIDAEQRTRPPDQDPFRHLVRRRGQAGP
ncbi:MAG TPA: cell division/cell wall cluster transcriptional repressor MraZ [Paracoccaceae bacterium]|nr:cell division/cell wall cluster transcriptional repressor MraZ [Paracoccaceae bacterium]